MRARYFAAREAARTRPHPRRPRRGQRRPWRRSRPRPFEVTSVSAAEPVHVAEPGTTARRQRRQQVVSQGRGKPTARLAPSDPHAADPPPGLPLVNSEGAPCWARARQSASPGSSWQEPRRRPGVPLGYRLPPGSSPGCGPPCGVRPRTRTCCRSTLDGQDCREAFERLREWSTETRPLAISFTPRRPRFPRRAPPAPAACRASPAPGLPG